MALDNEDESVALFEIPGASVRKAIDAIKNKDKDRVQLIDVRLLYNREIEMLAADIDLVL